MELLEITWLRIGIWVTNPRLRSEEGMTTAELLANVALGIAFAGAIFAAFTPLRSAVVSKIEETLKLNNATN